MKTQSYLIRIEAYAAGGSFWFVPSSILDVLVRFECGAHGSQLTALDRVLQLHRDGAFRDRFQDRHARSFAYTSPEQVLGFDSAVDAWREVFSDDTVSVAVRLPNQTLETNARSPR